MKDGQSIPTKTLNSATTESGIHDSRVEVVALQNHPQPQRAPVEYAEQQVGPQSCRTHGQLPCRDRLGRKCWASRSHLENIDLQN